MGDLVQVRIKGIVTTSKYGTLSSGDILRTDAAFAKHLVEDCGAADYLTKPAKSGFDQEISQDADTEKTTSRRKK